MNIITALPQDKDLGFGLYFAPDMILSRYKNGTWSEPELAPLKNLEMHPAAKCLHYAQEIFEGLKVYKQNGAIALFRPMDNIRRMTRSAEIMAMPPFPEDIFLRSMQELTRKCRHLVPDRPGALYLRPTMIGISTQLGVTPASEYLFYILASPVGGYFGKVSNDQPAGISVWITDEHMRAAPGGVGAAKTGANYAASLRAVNEAKKLGYSNVLFLDAHKRKYLEELSGMNVFFVHNGTLKTPPLGDTILDGITRKSVLELAQNMEIPTEENSISIDALIEHSASGAISEMFACGTGASITAITTFGWNDKKFQIANGQPGPITSKIYQVLTAIQTGERAPLHKDWIIKC